MQAAIPCSLLRGGTSKGLYFRATDLPTDAARRNRLLLAAMGSPDARQIDGVGGAHPLTSKVAVVGPSQRPDADLDYLFLQVAVDRAEVSDAQNCGNLLAAVGPFAIETGMVPAQSPETQVLIHMTNSGARAMARVQTPDGRVRYDGEARIDGVPGTAAPVPLEFLDAAGSSCGALLPTGRTSERARGVQVTCIDNGMPVVLLAASDFGLAGDEPPAVLEADAALKARIEDLRLVLGPRMGLGDVVAKTVPKMCLVSRGRRGGAIHTRTFIPHRVHEAIGVLGAVSVATACLLPGSVAHEVGGLAVGKGLVRVDVEHPTGAFTVDLEVSGAEAPNPPRVRRAALLRTARLLMRGEVMVPQAVA